MRQAILLGQGLYYVGTAVWALVSIGSFQSVTGPKVDTWLVKTVAALLLVVGAVLSLAGLRRRVTPEVELLAAGSALAFTVIDATYAGKGRISKVYLFDAAAETIGAAGLVLSHIRHDSAGAAAPAAFGPD